MRVCLISLGCDKNLCDSEVMLGLLKKADYEITDDESLAEIIIVNSCSFICDSMTESINEIIEAARYKTEGNCKALIVTGCLSERFKDEIKKELPEVDGMLGTASFDRICELIGKVLANDAKLPISIFDDHNKTVKGNYPRVLTGGGHYAYLKIAEGCNKRCTYCVIPSIRGSYRSVPMEDILDEARNLADKGVTELILVAQETTLYGIDLYKEKSLSRLLRNLSDIPQIRWIRLLYCYPEEITDELIDTIASLDKVVKYLDMPIQSASDNILRKMGRLTNREELTKLIKKLREKIPGICLRTTLISGFPGESDKDHRQTLDFVKEVEFDRLGVFTYSREEGTPAYDMDNQVDASVAQARRDEIMSLQQEISLKKGQAMIGKKIDAFVIGKMIDEDVYVGRSYKDAPDVDGYIFIDSDYELISGDIVEVKITKASHYDLIGEVVDESCE